MKPVVRYRDCTPVVIGETARVYPLDHPTAPNDRWVFTTRVVAISHYDGLSPVFETRNTRYVPAGYADVPAARYRPEEIHA